MIRRPPPSTLQRAAVLALVAVLLLAQTLGWLHRGLHGTPSVAQAVLVATQAQATADAGAKAFGHEAGTVECRLYDVLAQPGCAPAPLLQLPFAPPAAWLATALGDFVARWAALFDARGPPASR
jgi:hypothetical protein